MKFILSAGLFLFTILIGCSSSLQSTNDLKLEIVNHQIDSWVNLMPGSKPSFFISGSINIRNNEESNIDSVRLIKCEVLQEGNKLYELHPDLRSSVWNMDPLQPGTDRLFTLYLQSGTPIKKELKFEKPITVSLYLSALNRMNHYNIDSIYVMKTY
jgi:hypothetical protein